MPTQEHINGRRDFQARGVLSFGPFSLSLAERLLKKANDPVPLGGRALDTLIALTERAGEVVSYRELISIAWPNVTVDEANLRVQIATLRKALNDGEHGARYISNVAGRGYCFVAPVTSSTAPPIAAAGITDGERHRKLPPRLARVVGRDEAVRSVSQQLMTGRFVSIVGPGGIGKTTVAISVAHALLNGFSGADFFVDLSALTNPQLVPTAVASALGFMIQAHDPFGSLVAFLGDKKILLVLDNCEHVIDSAAVLAERVISEAPQAHILATSREALRVLSGGLAVSRRQNQADMRTHLIHRPARDIFHCSVELGFPPIELILWTLHAAAASLVQRNSVPSTHMRCMMTANRRAKATIAFFIPRRLTIWP